MMVAVGFQPTVDIIKMRLRRGATLETGHDPSPPNRIKRRSATQSIHHLLDRGLKPTATIKGRSATEEKTSSFQASQKGISLCTTRVVNRNK